MGNNSSLIEANTLVKSEDYDRLLMHDFSCKNPSDMYYKPLAEQVRYYKEDAEGVEAMCRIVEELIDSEKKEIALELLKLNKLSLEEIAKCSKLSLEEVERIAKDENILAGNQ